MMNSFKILLAGVTLFVFASGILPVYYSFIPGLQAQSPEPENVVITAVYPDPEEPGLTAELFAEGLISTPYNERDMTFSPDMKELYWSFKTPSFYTILKMGRENNRWSLPEVAPFSGRYFDIEPCFSPDGQRLYFASNRPLEQEKEPGDFNIWYVEKNAGGWGNPIYAGPEINSDKNEFYPSFTSDGSLYFCAAREGGIGGEDLYVSTFENGAYSDAVNLGDSINTEKDEFNAFVAPDGSWIIFTSTGWGEGFGGGDLWISFRKEDGLWHKPRNMGPSVNSGSLEYCPSLSPDGKYLFFTSNRSKYPKYEEFTLSYDDIIKMLENPQNGNQDIYWISSGVIEQLRP